MKTEHALQQVITGIDKGTQYLQDKTLRLIPKNFVRKSNEMLRGAFTTEAERQDMVKGIEAYYANLAYDEGLHDRENVDGDLMEVAVGEVGRFDGAIPDLDAVASRLIGRR